MFNKQVIRKDCENYLTKTKRIINFTDLFCCEKMNILLENGNVNPPSVEGTANILLTHAKELARKGHNVVILTRKKSIITGEEYPSFLIGIYDRKEEAYDVWEKYINLRNLAMSDGKILFFNGELNKTYIKDWFDDE